MASDLAPAFARLREMYEADGHRLRRDPYLVPDWDIVRVDFDETSHTEFDAEMFTADKHIWEHIVRGELRAAKR